MNFLPYSLPSLLKLCDEIVILDNSNDGSRKYLQQFENVHVYLEEDYPSMTYYDRRQFVLDKGRELGGKIFIVIDADEIISVELSKELTRIKQTQNGPYSVRCKQAHPTQDFDHMAYMYQYPDPSQGIMFYDEGLNCNGNNLVHENKIPYYDYIIDLHSYLIHFGLSDVNYIRAKARRYMLLEFLEGRPVDYLNLRYNHGIVVVKNTQHYTYPAYVDPDIFDMSEFIENQDKMVCNLILDNVDKLETLYKLDIWDSGYIVTRCMMTIAGFNIDKIRNNWRNYYWLKFIFNWRQMIYLLRHDRFWYLCMQGVRVINNHPRLQGVIQKFEENVGMILAHSKSDHAQYFHDLMTGIRYGYNGRVKRATITKDGCEITVQFYRLKDIFTMKYTTITNAGCEFPEFINYNGEQYRVLYDKCAIIARYN